MIPRYDESHFPNRKNYNINDMESNEYIITQTPPPPAPVTPSTTAPLPASTGLPSTVQPLHPTTPTRIIGAFPLDTIEEEPEVENLPLDAPNFTEHRGNTQWSDTSEDEVQNLLDSPSRTKPTTPRKPGKARAGKHSVTSPKKKSTREKKATRFLTLSHSGKTHGEATASLAISIDDISYALASKGAESTKDPWTLKEALSRPDADAWSEAARAEYESLLKNNTWDLVDLPERRKALKGKWVFKLKHDPDGNPIKYKARFCVKGYEQVPGLDFTETFAPVARYESIRTLLAMATLKDWHVHQMDVKTAFLNGDIEEEIYIEQPEGFKSGNNKVCKLNKALYGLKQAPRQWNKKIHQALIDLGFSCSKADTGIYIYQRQDEGEKEPMFIILYVDDVTLIAQNLTLLKSIKKKLANKFEMTDLGEISQYLGIRITRDRKNKNMWLDQHKFIKDVLERFGMTNCKSVKTPFETNLKLFKSEEEVNPTRRELYMSIVGSLQYLANGTRPDIAYATNKLAQFSVNPSEEHITTAKHVLRYLKGTQDLRLTYRANPEVKAYSKAIGFKETGTEQESQIEGFSDSDWAGDPNDSKSTTGYVYILAEGATAWKSTKQTSTALSSVEAEYMASCETAKHAAWLKKLYNDLDYHLPPIPIHIDNQGALALQDNPVFHQRSKHIKVKYHYVREAIQEEVITTHYIPTTDQSADILTKPLGSILHYKHLLNLGLTNVSTKGSVDVSNSVSNISQDTD
ncbi:hypothetical protein FRC01_008017 [Tulasnella sp. 417]|nr:hypothetical protein FRC01_008017 [Tulasnella sp. 417]